MRGILRWTARGMAGVLVLVLLAAGFGYGYLRQSLPQTRGTIPVDGLNGEVAVTRDRHGIPTIRADSMAGAYTALGFLHAQDRLFQLATVRRVAHGRVSAIAGPATLTLDKLMRVLGFAELAKRQIDTLAPRTRAALRAYADGINAYLRRDPVMPPLLQVTGAPEPWDAADSLAWLHLMALRLSGNWREEITNARLAERLSPAEMRVLYPGYDSGDPTTLHASARDGVARLAGALPSALSGRSASNAWIVDGSQTRDGGPLLANDPHLRLQSPSTWYLARIETPRRTLVGATSPGTPFMVAGRNKHLAWGITSTHSDTQDLVLEKLAADREGHYRTPTGSRAFATRTERIPVRGRDEPVRLTVRRTRHGPVLSDALSSAAAIAGNDTVVALRWPALRPDDRTMDALRRVPLAGDVETALKALKRVGAPQQNVHLADDSGTIAVAAPGRVPIRKTGDGTVPVQGWEREHGWTGFIPRDALPRRVDPPRGRIINANNKMVPEGYPYRLAAHWPPPHRAERIATRLDEAPEPLTAATMAAIQRDAHSPAAEALRQRLLRVEPPSPRARKAMRIVRAWDGDMAPDRTAPLIFTAWVDMLNRALFADALGPAFDAFTRPRPRRIRRALDHGGWCADAAPPDTATPCRRVIRTSLARALDKLSTRFGAAMTTWRWGAAHTTTLPHPILSRVPVLGSVIQPHLRTPGGDETVNRGGMRYGAAFGERYEHVHGPGLRTLHNLARPPESSRFVIAGGQSGNPLSPTYAGLAERWRRGRYLRLDGSPTSDAPTLHLVPTTTAGP